MKKCLSYILLLSLFLVQVHGLVHVEFDGHGPAHSCEVCELISHTPIVSDASTTLELSPILVSFISRQSDYNFIAPIDFNLSKLPARAPPAIS